MLLSLFIAIFSEEDTYTIITSFIPFALFIWIYLAIKYRYVFLTIEKDALIINSGIILKRSMLIPFDTIQNINDIRGPVSSMFNFVKVRIWTASPSQIYIKNGNSNNRPNGVLWLETKDVEDLRHILSLHK
ncbi:MAG: PH domain-containing protein [Candidatus Yonathbacteria bacterium]|nr:PH domain-containing protein [Candidatus Yonathbacteria bacterium]NTW47444.1 PH domain-containing protein [Candidatus Yonathbacteria bacterium]